MDWLLYRDGPVEPLPKWPVLAVTGAGGRVGSAIVPLLADRFRLRLMFGAAGEEAISRLEAFGEAVVGRLEEPDTLHPFFRGADAVLHLAANPHARAGWENLLRDNIVGLRNAMEAAREAGCRRFVFASSIHTVWAYPQDGPVAAEGPVRPANLYGVSKCFGEACGRYLAETGAMDVICLRLGAFLPPERLGPGHDAAFRAMWLSPRDLAQAVRLAVLDTCLRFGVFNVLSDNREKRLDLSETRRVLGYAPVDDAFAL